MVIDRPTSFIEIIETLEALPSGIIIELNRWDNPIHHLLLHIDFSLTEAISQPPPPPLLLEKKEEDLTEEEKVMIATFPNVNGVLDEGYIE